MMTDSNSSRHVALAAALGLSLSGSHAFAQTAAQPDAPVYGSPPVPVEEGELRSPDTVTRTIVRAQSEIQACIPDETEADVRMRLVIDASGQVTDGSLETAEAGDIPRCVARAIAELPFPSSGTEASAVVFRVHVGQTVRVSEVRITLP